jgi:hypothetical protein
MAAAKPKSRKPRGFVLGRERFEKLSAVEGISKGPESRKMFAEFDRAGLTAEQRRKAILERYSTRN